MNAIRKPLPESKPSDVLAALYIEQTDSRKKATKLRHIEDELQFAWVSYEQAADGEEGEVIARCTLTALARLCDTLADEMHRPYTFKPKTHECVEWLESHGEGMRNQPDLGDEYRAAANWIRGELRN